MGALAFEPARWMAGVPYMSNPKHIREADIAVQAENERLRREWDRLSLERKELTHEIDALREENTDLRESALMWLRLYDRALARANAPAAQAQPEVEAGPEEPAVAPGSQGVAGKTAAVNQTAREATDDAPGITSDLADE